MKTRLALLSVLFIAIITTGCNKANQTASKLEGSWEVESYKINGVSAGDLNATVTFSNIVENAGSMLTVTTNDDGTTNSSNQTFSINEDGDKITFVDSTNTYTYEIEFDGDNLILTDRNNSSVVELTFTKK